MAFQISTKTTMTAIGLFIVVLMSHLVVTAMGQPCGGTVEAGSGVIRSPNYPGAYPPDSSCSWTIQAGPETRLRIKFKDRDCSGDMLKILDGESGPNTPILGQYCDAQPPTSLDSSGGVITIQFESSGPEEHANQRGFEIAYESIDVALGSRVIWSEVNPDTGETRLNSIPADPTEMMAPDGTALDTIGASFYYRMPSGNWTAMATWYGEHEVVWSAANMKAIIKGTMGSTRQARSYFAWTSSTVFGITVDWLTGNVYWTDAAYDWIMMFSANGSRGSIVIDEGLDIPTGIAVHPARGLLFWTDSGSSPKVEKSNLAGGNRIELVTSGVVLPSGITIDYDTGLVYWVDADPSNNRVEVCDMDGANRRVLYATNADLEMTDLTISGEYIYVTARKTKNIIILAKSNGNVLLTLTIPYTPFSIITYAPDVQPPEFSPCSSNPCSYLCVGGGPNGYECKCGNGRLLTADGLTCEKEGTIDPPQYFVASQTKLCRYPINFPDLSLPQTINFNVSCFLGSRRHAVAITVDLEDGLNFFSDIGMKSIGMGTLRHGEPVKMITGGTKSVQGMAVDWVTKHLYWTDHGRGTIEVAKYDGSYRTSLIKDNVRRPRSIAIDPERKVMFWTEFGPPAQIERASLDGTDRVVIVTAPFGIPIFLPSGLAIDYEEQRLYYADVITKTINSVDYNGANKRQILRKIGAIFFDIALYKDYILWTELGGNNGIYASNRHTGQLTLTYHQRGEQVFGITTYADTRQKIVHSPCRFKNGGCDQLCLSSSSSQRGYVCQCTLGFHLAENGKNCLSDLVQDDFLLVTDTYRRAIFQVDMTSTTFEPKALSLASIMNPIAVSFDPVTRKVYWTDVAAQTLSRASLDGSQQEIIASDGVKHPDGIAVDPISRLLYWTDFKTHTLAVSHLDGSKRKILIRGLSKPRAIVLHPVEGLMFWTDWGSNPVIERAYMDGTQRSVIVSGSLVWPNGLTLDYDAEQLYWCDAGLEKIESSDLLGQGRRLVFAFGENLHTFDVAVIGQFIYWTDWVKQSVLKVDKATGRGNVTVGPNDYLRPNALHAVTRAAMPSGENSCSVNNGGCSGLCLPNVFGKTCTCPDGYEFDVDEVTCIPDQVTECPRSFEIGGVSEDCVPQPGNMCSVECGAGFFSSVDVVMCLASGSWDLNVHTLCRAQECPALPTPLHALAGPCYPPHTVGKLCMHECEQGFNRLSGDTRRVCDPHGEWLGTPIQCQESGGPIGPSVCDPNLEFLVQPENQEKAENDLVIASCRVNDPEVNILWYKDGQRMRSGVVQGIFVDNTNQLIIPEFEPRLEGHYECVARSGRRECLRAAANITFDPTSYFRVIPEDKKVEDGTSHVFECSPRASTSTIYWQKDDNLLEASDDVLLLEDGNLVLRNIGEEMEGKYTCVTRDQFGRIRGRADAWLFLSNLPQLDISKACGTTTYQRQGATPTPPPSDEFSPADGSSSDFGNSFAWSSQFAGDEENLSPRIVGGLEAVHGSAPFMVRIWVKSSNLFKCGATLLDQQWVLTAAHCIRYGEANLQARDILLYLGDYDSEDREEPDDSQKVREAAEIILHEDYDENTFDNDIALIRMDAPLRRFTPYIRPICLAPGGLSRRLLVADNLGRVTGWGRVSYNGPTPRFMKEVELPVVTHEVCQPTTRNPLTDRMFCAGYYLRQRDACRGDSGGPFAFRYLGRWYQAGIVSWGEECAAEGEYGVYTHVSQFLHWLRSKNATVASSPGVEEMYSRGENASLRLEFAQRSASSLTVAVGDPVSLECIPNRNDAIVRWYIGDILITQATPLTHGVHIGSSHLTLDFPEVQSSFQGGYRCEVSVGDAEGEQSLTAHFHLDVTSS